MRGLIAGTLLLGIVAVGTWWLLRGDESAQPNPQAPVTAKEAERHSIEQGSLAATPDEELDAQRLESTVREEEEDDSGVVESPGPGTYQVRGTVRHASTGNPVSNALVFAQVRRPSLTVMNLSANIQGQMHKRKPAAFHSMQGSEFQEDEFPEVDAEPSEAANPVVGWGDVSRVQTRTDATGAFALEGVPTRHFFLCADVPQHCVVSDCQVKIPEDSAFTSLDVVVAKAGTIHGTVVDAGGDPVPGARVEIYQPFNPFEFASGNLTMRTPHQEECNDQGTFHLDSIPPDIELQLRAHSAPHSRSRRQDVVVRSGETETVALVLGARTELHVTVRDESGREIENARVRVRSTKIDLNDISTGGGLSQDIRNTDETGVAKFLGQAPGPVSVRVSHADYRTSDLHDALISAEESRSVEVVMVPGLSVEGKVVDPEGAPVAFAKVKATRKITLSNLLSMEDNAETPWQSTDEEGVFHLRNLPAGDLVISAEARDYQRSEMSASSGTTGLVLTLKPAAAVEGIVVSRVTGDVVKRFSLRANQKQTFSMNPADWENTARNHEVFPYASSNGKFRLTGIPQGRYQLTIEADDHAKFTSDWLEIEEGQVIRGFVAYLDPEARISGTVTNAETGQPVAGAQVLVATRSTNPITLAMERMFGGDTVETGEDGRFEIGGLSAGTYQLSSRHLEFAEFNRSGIEIGRGEVLDGVQLAMERGAEIFGRVLDDRGDAVVGQRILASDTTGSSVKTSTSDAEGNYRIVALAPGRYSLTRMPGSFSFDSDNFMKQFADGIETKTVSLKAGESAEVDFGEGWRGTGKLQGIVRQGDQPVAGAFVTAVARGDSLPALGSSGGRTTITDPDGSFEFTGLPAGEAIAQVQTNVGGFVLPESVHLQEVHITAEGVTEANFEIPAGSIRGVVQGLEDGEGLAGVPVYAERVDRDYSRNGLLAYGSSRPSTTVSGADGAFTLRNLASGTYRVLAGGSDLLQFSPAEHALTILDNIEVREGQAQEVGAIALAPAARIVGTVTGPDGRPVAGATLFLRPSDGGPLLQAFSSVSTDISGSFTYQGVPEGSFQVICKAPDYALTESRPVRVRTGESSEVSFRLKPGTRVVVLFDHEQVDTASLSTLDLEVIGPDGKVVSGMFGLSDLLAATFEPVESGAYPVGTYGPGNYRVRGQLAGKSFEKEFELRGEPELRIPVEIP